MGLPGRNAPLPGFLGRLLAPIYGAVVAQRNRRWDAGRGVVTLDRPVISVGNLSVGGTGKTPMVAHLVRVLIEAGRRPCIAMRGYKAPAGRGQESDEAREYGAMYPSIPIVAQPNRLDGLIDLFATPEGEAVDCVVLDDGFQHRRIARQLDVVLIDATRSPFEDRLLPAGWLREPVENLARADACVITHAGGERDVKEIEGRVRSIVPRAAMAACDHEWSGLTVHDASGARAEHVGWLRGRRVFACCAIGNAGAFLALAKRVCGGLAGEWALRDHDPFAPATRLSLHERLVASRADALLVTSKDWAKLGSDPAERWPAPVVVPTLALGFGHGREELEAAVVRAARTPVADEP